MMNKKTKGYRGGGKVKKMSKGGAMGGKKGGSSMSLAQLRAAASAKGMTLSPIMKAAKGGAVKKK